MNYKDVLSVPRSTVASSIVKWKKSRTCLEVWTLVWEMSPTVTITELQSSVEVGQPGRTMTISAASESR